jgi:hypothetical protein
MLTSREALAHLLERTEDMSCTRRRPEAYS